MNLEDILAESEAQWRFCSCSPVPVDRETLSREVASVLQLVDELQSANPELDAVARAALEEIEASWRVDWERMTLSDSGDGKLEKEVQTVGEFQGDGDVQVEDVAVGTEVPSFDIDDQEEEEEIEELTQLEKVELEFSTYFKALDKMKSSSTLLPDMEKESTSLEFDKSKSFISRRSLIRMKECLPTLLPEPRLTCITIHHKHYALGSLEGRVLLFSNDQTLVESFNTPSKAQDNFKKKVSVVSFSPHGNLLLIGNVNGDLFIWDLLVKKFTRSFHSFCDGPVAIADFLDIQGSSKVFVVSDKGNFKTISLTTSIFNYPFDFSPLNQLCSEKVLAASALRMSPSTSKPILELIPFAYATLSKVAIISLSQQLTLDVWKAPIEEDVNCVTCLAWKTSEKSAIDINSIESKNARLMSRYPALATSWGRQIAVKVLVPIRKQLSFSTRVSVVVKKISEFDLSQIIVSLFWIENKYLVAINRNLDMFVLDPLSSQILEVIGGSESKLMPSLKFKLTVEDKSEFELDKYNTSAASTFSEAVMLIITESDDLLIESFSLRSWEAIVDELILNNQWMKAFMFGISMFESSSTETKDKMHSNYHLQVSDRFLILLLRHIDQVFSSATEAKEYNSSSINELAEVSINFCSKLERVEFLLSEVFPRFKSFSCEKVFLDVLTQYILHDKITFLDNVSLSNLVSYYCYIGKPKKAEECIFHLSFTTTDPHHSVSVCKENGLISGLIYSLCEGFHDFTSSITIVQQLMLKTSSENYKNWGYQLLLYLKFSLSGLKFPRKTAYLPESAIRIRSQILNYLFTPYISNASEQYTHLLFWLRFDAAAFLSAISCALDSRYWEYDTISDVSNTDLSVRKKNSLDQPSFIGENPNAFFDIFSQVSRMSAFVSSGVSTVIGGINQQSVLTVNSYNSSAANENPKLLDNPIITEKADLIQSPLSNSPASVPNPQEIVDLLSSLLLHSEQVDQRVVFLDFISVYLASGVVSAPSSVIDEVFQLLFMGTWTMTESITRRNRTKILRQERILSLMAKYPPVNDIERQKLLTLANSAGFYKISEKIYAFYKDYLSMFRIYVRNPEIHEPLEFFMRVMNLGNVDKGTIQKLKHEFIKSLESLLSIDRDLTIGTLAKYFTTDVLVDEILSKLLDETLQFRFFSLVFESLEREKSSKITSLQSAYYERYIELLCINEPDKVYHHLTISSDYDIHRMLSLCQRFSISDACAYLLERTGDLHGALSMMLMNFDNALEEVFSKTIESFDYPFAYHNFFNLDKIRKHLHVASDLCERCSIRNDSENENLWNIVLKHVIMKQLSNRQNSMERNLHPNMFAAINQFWIQASQFVIDRMRHYIRIEGILKCIFETGSHLRSSEFRCVVEDMLSGFAADKSIFTTAVKIFSLDLHNSSHELSRLLSKPFDCSLGQLSCAKCRKMLIEKSAVPSSTSIPSIHVFDCQHAFHRACLQIGSEDCPLCFVSQKRIGSTKSAYGKVRRIHSDLSRVKAKSFIQSKSIAIKPSMSTFEAYLSLKNGST